MATTRVLSREDGDLNTVSIITSRSKQYLDIDLSFTAKPNGELYKKRDGAAVKQAVKNLIQTNFFEKPFQPFYGANLRDLLFELAYDDVADDVRDNIVAAVETYEPRAKLLDIKVEAQPEYNSISVTIEFQVVNTDEIVKFTTAVSRLR